MMKSTILVACLVLSVSAAPAPEPQKGGKAAKLQFEPADAQQSFYQSAVGIAPEQQTVIRVAEAPRTIIKSVAQSPLYVAAPAAASAILPYSSSRTTLTTTGQAGQLPDGYVWEHHGASHIGHTSQAIHVKKQGALSYGLAAPAVSVSGLQIVPQAQIVPQSILSSYALSAPARNGQITIINGRQAQHLNGQWYYISPQVAASTGAWNSAWNQAALSAPAYQTVSLAAAQPQVLSYAVPQPQTVTLIEQQQPQTVTIAAPQPALTLAAPGIQTVKTYTQEIARPAIDSKWYTKTNRAVIQPFYAQAPQYVEIAQASEASKRQSPVKPEIEDEKDW